MTRIIIYATVLASAGYLYWAYPYVEAVARGALVLIGVKP
jgi:hypothetical protein